MGQRSRSLVLGVVAWFALGAVAQAETAAEAITRWGLIGTWYSDCANPATDGAPRVRWTVRNGAPLSERDYATHRDSSQIRSAVIRPDGMIDIVIVFSTVRLNRFRKSQDGAIQNVFNQDVDTKAIVVQDGKILANGNAMAWLHHCSAQ